MSWQVLDLSVLTPTVWVRLEIFYKLFLTFDCNATVSFNLKVIEGVWNFLVAVSRPKAFQITPALIFFSLLKA